MDTRVLATGPRGRLCAWVVLALLAGRPTGAAAGWQETARIRGIDVGGIGSKDFGSCVHSDGDRLLVGAAFNGIGGTFPGSAYVLRRDGAHWQLEANLTPTGLFQYEGFGRSVHVSGDYAFVGSYNGRLYVFRHSVDGWQEHARLRDPNAEGEVASIAFNGTDLLVGYPDGAGCVYIFQRCLGGWAQVGQIHGQGTNAAFGAGLAVYGQVMVVGASQSDSPIRAGRVHLLSHDGLAWVQGSTLAAAQPAAYAGFGTSVSLREANLAVGDAFGAVHMFMYDGTQWAWLAELDVGGQAVAVSLSEDVVVAGSWFMDCARVFSRSGSTWRLATTLFAAGGAVGDAYGQAVAAEGDCIFIGAPEHEGAGAVYVYEYVSPPARPVYRFWSPVNKRHFYTISESEMNKLIDRYAHVWTYECMAYDALPDAGDPQSRPVHRFWSATLSAHFYTMDTSEKDKLIARYPGIWTYEGPAFYAWPEGFQPPGARPVYRFWSNTLHCHFYTISDAEKQKLIDTYSRVWTYEGVAWYAHE